MKTRNPQSTETLVNDEVVWLLEEGETGNTGEGETGEGNTGEADAAAAAAAAAAEAAAAAGKRKITDEEARLLKDAMKHKQAAKEAAEERDRLKAQLDGIDIEKAKELLAKQREIEEAALVERGEFTKVKEQMVAAAARERQALVDELAAKNAALAAQQSLVEELSIGQSFNHSKFREELTLTANKARKLYADHFDIVDGKLVGHDKPRGTANRAPLVDQYGEPLEFDGAFKAIVDADPDKDDLYKSKMSQGAGSQSNATSKKPEPQVEVRGISRIAAGLADLAKKGGIAA
jgi:hypothetical protein